VDDWIYALAAHIVCEEVEESVFGVVELAVVIDGKSRIEIYVILEHRDNVVVLERIIDKQRRVGREGSLRAVFLVGGYNGVVLLADAFGKYHALALSVAE
jgi:hypothetical protein